MAVHQITQENFEALVQSNEKLVLLDFYADWCGPCRMVSPVVEEIAAERADITVGKVNVDEVPSLAQDFGVISIPTLVVMRAGEVVNTAVGARTKDAILAMLDLS